MYGRTSGGTAVAFILALGLLGCAAGRPVPETASAEEPSPESGQGRICFYVHLRARHPGFQPMITLDGQEVGRAEPGGFFCVDLPAGRHEVAHLEKGGSHRETKTVDDRSRKTFPLAAGETLYIEMIPNPGSGFEPSRGPYEPIYLRAVLVDPEQAREAVRACRHIGSGPPPEETGE